MAQLKLESGYLMRFLRSKSGLPALAIVVIGLGLNCARSFAASTSTEVVVEANDVDLAKLQTGGEIVFVSSGQRLAVAHAIDDDRRTIFQFSNTDSRPTMIVKLTENKPIHRVSVVVGSEAGKVDVYLLGEIPSDLSALDQVTPVGSIVDLGVAEAALDFSPQNARYVALRWAFSNSHPRPLVVAEVSIFGTEAADPSALALAAVNPPPDPIQNPPILAAASP